MVTIDEVKMLRTEEEYKKIRKMFKAVLAQAANDAFLNNGKTKYDRLMKSYALVFFEGGEDLREVCDLADVSYDRIVAVSKKLDKSNVKNYKKILSLLKS